MVIERLKQYLNNEEIEKESKNASFNCILLIDNPSKKQYDYWATKMDLTGDEKEIVIEGDCFCNESKQEGETKELDCLEQPLLCTSSNEEVETNLDDLVAIYLVGEANSTYVDKNTEHKRALKEATQPYIKDVVHNISSKRKIHQEYRKISEKD